MADLKNLITSNCPYLEPRLSSYGINSTNFSWDCPLKYFLICKIFDKKRGLYCY
jgi:hypothetical protein